MFPESRDKAQHMVNYPVIKNYLPKTNEPKCFDPSSLFVNLKLELGDQRIFRQKREISAPKVGHFCGWPNLSDGQRGMQA